MAPRLVEIGRFVLAARVFTVAALISLAAVVGPSSVHGALLLIPLALTAQVLSLTRRYTLVAILEGAAAAGLSLLTQPSGDSAVLPYLTVPALIAALSIGRRGLFEVVSAELVVLVGPAAFGLVELSRSTLASGLTWLAAAFGLGLAGTAFRRASVYEDDPSYRNAVQLIRALAHLTGNLPEGLDQVGLVDDLLTTVDDLVALNHAAMFVTNGERLHPLRTSPGSPPEFLARAEGLAERVSRSRALTTDDSFLALPVMAETEQVGVLVLDVVRQPEAATRERLEQVLRGAAIRLVAARLFGEVQEAATSEERHRLAREVHDGVAQDVASLGYLVDNLAARPRDEAQAAQIAQLRAELSRVVSELRRSVFDLRREVPAGEGLGASLGTFAHHIGTVARVTVHLTLTESERSLAPEVETQLLRIGQEAMTNVRKHAQAQHLWLTCTVDAPHAWLEIRDDGRRPHSSTEHSQGIAIMRERAASIGASLTIQPPSDTDSGTRVTVQLGERPASLTPGGGP